MDYTLLSNFPINRLRRLRMNPLINAMMSETTVLRKDLVQPLFVVPGSSIKQEIPSMPGCYHLSIDNIIKEVKELINVGLHSILLFGIPEKKDEMGSESFNEDGIVQRCVSEIKSQFNNSIVMTDVCLCEYKSDGHCGIVENGVIVNDKTLDILAKIAVSHVRSGADIIAPSDMMDGRVAAIRQALDSNGFNNTPIMSYAAKYASSFYGPFREAAQSLPAFGDRKSHQLNIANSDEAMREIAIDISEGADIIMIKPALAYLDIIKRAKDTFPVPIAAYNVSGEYSMIKAAARNGWIDEERAILEILTSIKRAGATIIISYHSKEIAEKLR